ncbi:uncharacterized protein BO72DRAFT_123787 [Aspergillus fijiensis CBS 313.89]|uniref:Secreted protein n=1 Tax=Aspergillus fijiensis CBS 313.89 TaxID=1448319 RepID=A0A8G1VYN0_9EURO|nr:uncharacterized protein BO72DRAFT_123787 [Aspergillus fijiensis CBS 313.89]RAK76623.1 hypothetical protein BO72DRAFT_123787 [Aspergillus fijiensis CBS 313.89]
MLDYIVFFFFSFFCWSAPPPLPFSYPVNGNKCTFGRQVEDRHGDPSVHHRCYRLNRSLPSSFVFAGLFSELNPRGIPKIRVESVDTRDFIMPNLEKGNRPNRKSRTIL